MRIFASRALTQGDPYGHDHEIAEVMNRLGGKWIAQGTHLPTMVRDWEFDLAPVNVAPAVKHLQAVGFKVWFDAEGGKQ